MPGTLLVFPFWKLSSFPLLVIAVFTSTSFHKGHNTAYCTLVTRYFSSWWRNIFQTLSNQFIQPIEEHVILQLIWKQEDCLLRPPRLLPASRRGLPCLFICLFHIVYLLILCISLIVCFYTYICLSCLISTNQSMLTRNNRQDYTIKNPGQWMSSPE